MSQALHTSSTGINVGQSQINVIAHNVANVNTVAYKTANMLFETLHSNNLSYGSAATKDGGGTTGAKSERKYPPCKKIFQPYSASVW